MNHKDRWRTVQASVTGVAHQVSDMECQDACAVQSVTRANHQPPVLVLVVADGAGSAPRSRDGAEQACQTLLTECATWLTQPNLDNNWQPGIATFWLQRLQTALAQQAAAADLSIREFACTLLGAIVAPDQALFWQIGDGAIVINAGASYQPVFWPQGGQYVNETRFVTDPDAADYLECVVLAESVAEIALLTDGLQPLALHYQSRQAHQPFFRPLFQSLRDYPEAGSSMALTQALEQFLQSPQVNQRTDDDKTLILATRQSIGNLHDDADNPATVQTAHPVTLPVEQTAILPENPPSASALLPGSERNWREEESTPAPEFEDDADDPTL